MKRDIYTGLLIILVGDRMVHKILYRTLLYQEILIIKNETANYSNFNIDGDDRCIDIRIWSISGWD